PARVRGLATRRRVPVRPGWSWPRGSWAGVYGGDELGGWPCGHRSWRPAAPQDQHLSRGGRRYVEAFVRGTSAPLVAAGRRPRALGRLGVPGGRVAWLRWHSHAAVSPRVPGDQITRPPAHSVPAPAAFAPLVARIGEGRGPSHGLSLLFS